MSSEMVYRYLGHMPEYKPNKFDIVGGGEYKFEGGNLTTEQLSEYVGGLGESRAITVVGGLDDTPISDQRIAELINEELCEGGYDSDRDDNIVQSITSEEDYRPLSTVTLNAVTDEDTTNIMEFGVVD